MLTFFNLFIVNLTSLSFFPGFEVVLLLIIDQMLGMKERTKGWLGLGLVRLVINNESKGSGSSTGLFGIIYPVQLKLNCST
jgi:hypothetical protein